MAVVATYPFNITRHGPSELGVLNREAVFILTNVGYQPVAALLFTSEVYVASGRSAASFPPVSSQYLESMPCIEGDILGVTRFEIRERTLLITPGENLFHQARSVALALLRGVYTNER